VVNVTRKIKSLPLHRFPDRKEKSAVCLDDMCLMMVDLISFGIK